MPRVTLVTRKAYGGAYVAMNSKALGATAVFARPPQDLPALLRLADHRLDLGVHRQIHRGRRPAARRSPASAGWRGAGC